MSKTNEEKPSYDWANWALAQAALSTPETKLEPQTLGHMLALRLQRLVGEHEEGTVVPGPRSFVGLSDSGYWARGATLHEMANNLHSEGASKTAVVRVVLVLNDGEPQVDGYGTVVSASVSAQLNLGNVGTVSSILRARKG